MSKPLVVQNEVLSYAPSSDKPGAWLKMAIIDDKGQKRDSYIKDAALMALVNQPGVYEFTKIKEGQYYNITGVKFLRPAGGAPAAASTNGGNAQAPARVAGQLDPNVVVQNKSITAQVAMKATADILVAALNNGAFKGGEGIVDLTDVGNYAAQLVRVMLDEAKNFTGAKTPEPTKVAAPAQQPAAETEGA